MTDDNNTNRDKAVAFLNQVIAGDIENAYQAYVNLEGKHHNMYTPAGFESLKEGMQAAGDQSPDMTFDVKNVFGEGDLIAVHSHLVMKSDEPGMATVHMFRFENGKIIELWDVAQTIPDDQVNSDGAF